MSSTYPPWANLRDEQERLNTFETWSCTFISPEELAANGFYYSGYLNMTPCAFCRIGIMRWAEGDKVEICHREASPNCDFVMGRPCGNIEKAFSPSRAPTAALEGCDTSGAYGSPRHDADVENLARHLLNLRINETFRPISYNLTSFEDRLRTFDNWDPDCPVRPEPLAEAGFYAQGKNIVSCFRCAGGLDNWQKDDEPWFEHARWFPKCEFVKIHKKPDFIERARQTATALPLPVQTDKNEKSSKTKDEDSAPDNAQVQESEKCMPLPTDKESLDEQSGKKKGEDSVPENVEVPESERCVVCMTEERTIIFIPCGHLVTCGTCTSALSSCPLCREPCLGTIRAHF